MAPPRWPLKMLPNYNYRSIGETRRQHGFHIDCAYKRFLTGAGAMFHQTAVMMEFLDVA